MQYEINYDGNFLINVSVVGPLFSSSFVLLVILYIKLDFITCHKLRKTRYYISIIILFSSGSVMELFIRTRLEAFRLS